MITLQELSTYLGELLQNETISDYGPNGIQVEGFATIAKIATSVTASLAAIQAAVSCGADALIVHHGLFWNKDSYVISGAKREKLRLLLEHDISLLAYHLPLDAHQQLGNNWKAARDMGWTNLQPFGICNGVAIGVKGDVPYQSRKEFQATLEKYYQHPAYCALGGREQIQSAALISGGAHRNIEEAIKERVDCFVTGSFDEPVWHQAHEGCVNFFALGHSATERIGPMALGEHLHKHFGIQHEFIDILNPF